MHRTALALFLPLVLLALLPGCAGSASTGEAMHQDMVEQGAPYNDPELQAYVTRIGQRLVASSDEPDTTFTFTVLDSPDINAFALPGGYIYINRGLLAYLENEAELAGVLAHEIGHITASHHNRRQAASVANKVVATTTYVLTGSGDLANASNMYGTELVSGYGRDMELEADGLAAEYMYNVGYDPESLLEVIGALKDQEQFQRIKAKAGGKPVATYHGLYASHPRNDQRLKTVIQAAGELDSSAQPDDPAVPGEFQQHIEGLVWGESVPSDRSESRYYHNKLGFTFERPLDWTVTAGARAIVASAPDGSSELTITVRRRDPNASPQAVLEGSLTGQLSAGAKLDQAGLKGYTGITGSGAGARRVAVIDYNNLSYLFDGAAQNFSAQDAALLAMIESFRPMHPAEQGTSNGLYVHYIQVPQGATMASLAASTRIPDAEAQLRLLNGLYPRGEPRTGDWIKVIR
ncbi:MAG: M48 family metalloprotease [Halioglobus sp.]|nr:M48 family metalloprotease [Halioglobus sp.]